MTAEARSDRTARILIARLEELARALDRSGVSSDAAARLLASASIATMNAVALELLSSDDAEAIWRDIADRHPEIEPLRTAPRRLAA